MANKVAQAKRLAEENLHTPSLDEIAGRAASVIGRYRLQPDDLPSEGYVGQIHSINTQGVEALTPLVYITGLAKPLALSEIDVQTLVRISDSPFSSDWIGRTVEVRAVRMDGERRLRLYAPGAVSWPIDEPSPPYRRQRTALIGALFVLIVAITAMLIVFTEQIVALWTLLEEAITSFWGR
ncbi:MAG: hypothetical protein ACK4SA_24825 [Caldilinea sp.]